MIRAHEAKPDGYEFHMLKSDGKPLCITVFSAPNYCGSYGNLAAVFCASSRRGMEEDVLTFEEDASKPVVLRLNE